MVDERTKNQRHLDDISIHKWKDGERESNHITNRLDGIIIVLPPLITLTGPNFGHAPPYPRLILNRHQAVRHRRMIESKRKASIEMRPAGRRGESSGNAVA